MCGSVVHTYNGCVVQPAIPCMYIRMHNSKQPASFIFEDNHRAESTVCASTTITYIVGKSLGNKYCWGYSKHSTWTNWNMNCITELSHFLLKANT